MFHIDSNLIWMELVFQTIVCCKGSWWIFSFFCRPKRLMGERPCWTEESNYQFLSNSIFTHSLVKTVIKRGEKGWEYTTLYCRERSTSFSLEKKKYCKKKWMQHCHNEARLCCFILMTCSSVQRNWFCCRKHGQRVSINWYLLMIHFHTVITQTVLLLFITLHHDFIWLTKLQTDKDRLISLLRFTAPDLNKQVAKQIQTKVKPML